MTGGQLVRELERQLLPVRTAAAVREAGNRYADEVVSPAASVQDVGKIMQGFDAGYAAAMAEVRKILINLQSMALRGTE